jgi:hypothetical protein
MDENSNPNTFKNIQQKTLKKLIAQDKFKNSENYQIIFEECDYDASISKKLFCRGYGEQMFPDCEESLEQIFELYKISKNIRSLVNCEHK